MTTGPDRIPLIDEQLSAWLDDELPGMEVEMLANRLSASAEHQARLARYSLIGCALRSGDADRSQSELAALRLSGRVRAALQDSADVSSRGGSWRAQRLLPYALAAGVALVAIGVALVQDPFLRPAGDALVAGSAPGTRVEALVDPVPLRAVRTGAGTHDPLSPGRLTSYLVYHGEYSGMLSARVTESHIVNHSPYAVALRAVDRPPVP